MKHLDRKDAIEKLIVIRHRLDAALDRFYKNELPGDPVALEAAVLDISTPIRVMVHHVPEKKSACLLYQVDPEYWKKLIHFQPLINPPSKTLPSGLTSVSRSIPVNVHFKIDGAASSMSFTRYDRQAHSEEPRTALKNWWIDTVWDSGSNKVSNKDIVLAMVNKEGGAHVDGDASAKYRAAKAQGHLSVGGKQISDIARLGSLIGIAGDELLEYVDQNFADLLGRN